jgi:hypothetical protein
MIRTQIQLTEDQAAQLRAMAARLDVSLSEMVRRLVAQAGRSMPGPTEEEDRARALAVIGRFASGRGDVSTDHDRHLAEAFAR